MKKGFKPFWAMSNPFMGMFWNVVGRSGGMYPSVYPELSKEDMRSSLSEEIRAKRKKANKLADFKRKQQRRAW